MRNFVKWLGIIAFVTVIGFLFIACKKDSLDRTTWKLSSEFADDEHDIILTFNHPNFTLTQSFYGDQRTTTGTYSMSGNTVTLGVDGNGVTATISGNQFVLGGDITLIKQESTPRKISGTSALVGRWVHESGTTRNKPENIELLRDGTGVCDGTSITWKVDGNRFIIQSSAFGLACNYEVSGGKLNLTYDDNSRATFTKR